MGEPIAPCGGGHRLQHEAVYGLRYGHVGSLVPQREGTAAERVARGEHGLKKCQGLASNVRICGSKMNRTVSREHRLRAYRGAGGRAMPRSGSPKRSNRLGHRRV